VQVWRLVNGPIRGRDRIHTPLGARFGTDGAVTRWLLVDPQRLVGDPARTKALMIDLAGLAVEPGHSFELACAGLHRPRICGRQGETMDRVRGELGERTCLPCLIRSRAGSPLPASTHRVHQRTYPGVGQPNVEAAQ
jgi:hypothetical protein